MSDRHVVIVWLDDGRCPEIAAVLGPYDTRHEAEAGAQRARERNGGHVTVESLGPPR